MTTSSENNNECKRCSIILNEASIIPCDGSNPITSKCLMLNVSNEKEDQQQSFRADETKTLKQDERFNENICMKKTNNENNKNTDYSSFSSSIISFTLKPTSFNSDNYTTQIEIQTNKIIEQIKRTADLKINEIESIKHKLIDQIKMDKRDLLRSTSSRSRSRTEDVVDNDIYECLHDSVSNLGMKPPQELVGIRFNPTEEKLRITELGNIQYNENFKIDTLYKLTMLNNDFQYKFINLSHYITPITTFKNIQLLESDKVLLIHEKELGRVRITYLKVVFQDGSVMYENQRENPYAFFSSHAIFPNKYICLSFEITHNDFYVLLYDFKLNYIREKSIDYQINSVYMSDDRIYLKKDPQKHHSKLINEYSYDFNFIGSYGQSKSAKKVLLIQ